MSDEVEKLRELREKLTSRSLERKEKEPDMVSELMEMMDSYIAEIRRAQTKIGELYKTRLEKGGVDIRWHKYLAYQIDQVVEEYELSARVYEKLIRYVSQLVENKAIDDTFLRFKLELKLAELEAKIRSMQIVYMHGPEV